MYRTSLEIDPKFLNINMAEAFGVEFSGPNVNCFCPICEDPETSETPSCSVGVNGLWFCHRCGAKGNVIKFYSERCDISYDEAEAELTKTATEPLPEDDIDAWTFQLWKESHIPQQEYLTNIRGISKKTLIANRVGYCIDNNAGGRFTIPIFNEEGQLVNVRKYSRTKKPKMLSVRGHGQTRLFPMSTFEDFDPSRPLILCEGEWDALVLIDRGYQAVSLTGGGWPKDLTKYFEVPGLRCIICYDVNDITDTGEHKRKLARQMLTGVCRLYDIWLPLDNRGGDVTDYFVNYGNSVESFEELIQEALSTEELPQYASEEDTTELNSVEEATDTRYFGRKIRVPVLVTGKTETKHTVPVSYTLADGSVRLMNESLEAVMPVWPNYADAEKKKREDLNRLRFALWDDEAQEEAQGAERRLGVIAHLTLRSPLNSANEMEDVAGAITNIQARCLCEGRDDIVAGREYIAEGTMSTLDKDSRAIFAIRKMIPTSSYAEVLDLDSEEIEKMRKQVAPEGGAEANAEQVYNRLEHIARHLSFQTKCWGREILHLAVDLVYHSQISYFYQNALIRRAWLDLMILGDTRTGKGLTVEGIRKYYKAGTLVNAEQATIPGLIGSCSQKNGDWSVSWGSLPLNDRGLVAIDEASGFKDGELSKVTRVRSEGIVEITKAGAATAYARCRLIWIANPVVTRKRTSLTISDYGRGIEALNELFSTKEDISRLDGCVICAQGDVSLETIIDGYPSDDECAKAYDRTVLRGILRWCWTRAASDIIFELGIEQTLKEEVSRLDELIDSEIGLFPSEDLHKILIRWALAIAGRLFSTDEGGQRLIVKKAHIEAASLILERIHSETSNGLITVVPSSHSSLDESENTSDSTEIAVAKKAGSGMIAESTVFALPPNFKFDLLQNTIGVPTPSGPKTESTPTQTAATIKPDWMANYDNIGVQNTSPNVPIIPAKPQGVGRPKKPAKEGEILMKEDIRSYKQEKERANAIKSLECIARRMGGKEKVFLEALIRESTPSIQAIAEYCGTDEFLVRDVFAELMQIGALRRREGGYRQAMFMKQIWLNRAIKERQMQLQLHSKER